MVDATTHPVQVYRDDHPIERGYTLLEASAGTGKTYSLTFLYLRLLLEERLAPREIVVVTFTNAAAAELRDRIHQRIAEAIQVLEPDGNADAVDQGARTAIESIVARTECRHQIDKEQIRQQLNEASATLDTSVISTIHSFAGRLGEEFSTITGTPSGATLVDNLYDILDETLLDVEHQLAEEFPDAAQLLVGYGGKVHGFIRSIARVLLDNPDVLPPPDHLLLLDAQQILLQNEDAPLREEDLRDLPRVFIAGVRAFVDWMHQGGEAHWRAWFDEVRKVKSIHGNSLRAASIEQAFETVARLRTALNAETDDATLAHTIVRMLEPHASNGGPLRFFRYDFLNEKHKAAEGATSASPTGHELPASSLDVEACYQQAELLQNTAFRSVWCYGVAQKVVALTRERAAAKGLRSHAQVIADVADALRGTQRQALVDAVQKKYRAALIDEFQDTDLLQWEIFEALFSAHHAITYLIGDPKQAIYGFRGANVAVYEEVRQTHVRPERIMSLDVNYRSDRAYNETINGVFAPESPAELDGFVQIRSPKRTPERRLELQEIAPPASLAEQRAVLTGGDPNDALIVHYVCELNSAPFAQHCADHIAHEILALLREKEKHRLYRGDQWTPIQTGDCAVLVRYNTDAQRVVQTLQRAGIPAVLRDKQSVALSDAADGLMHWLQALAQPRNQRAIRSFLFSPFVRLPLHTLDALPEDELTAWAEFFGELRTHWYRNGLHATLRKTLHRPLQTDNQDTTPGPDIMTHLLSRDDGMRVAGDLMHLAEVLNTAQRKERLSIEGLLSWFARARYDEENQSTDNPLFQRRVATDDDAVQVVTGHSSKGLEYPLVWMFGFTKGEPSPSFLIHPERPVTRYAVTRDSYYDLKNAAERDEDATPLTQEQTQALLNIAHTLYPSFSSLPPLPTASDSNAHFTLQDAVAASDAYAKGEELRLLYVALTRACQRAVIYVNARAGNRHNDQAPAFTLDVERGELDRALPKAPHGIGALARSTPWEKGTLRIEQWIAPASDTIELTPYQSETTHLQDQMLLRTPPVVTSTRGQRPSFSSLVHLLPDHFGYFDIDEEPVMSAEDTNETQPTARTHLEGGSDTLMAEALPLDSHKALPLSNFVSGREAGTALHTVFELVDFEGAKATRLQESYRDHVHEQAHRALVSNGIDPHHQAQILTEGVLATLQTPIGGALGDFRLADLSRAHRIDEMQFLMPVGDKVHPTTSDAIFAALQTRKGDSAIDPAWFQDLDAGMRQSIDLQGMMIGFIDLVFRADVNGTPQYFVADYKSNRLAPLGEPITAAHFAYEKLVKEMADHHYYLQYHLYLVALHRWLRARLPYYDYDTHVGGAYYLFVRGMEGASTPIENGYARGVFFDRPPFSVIDALDRALQQAATRTGDEVSA